MMHHEESAGKKDLYVVPICGLGNRLLAIMAALYYKHGDNRYSNVSVLWARDMEFCLPHEEFIKASIDFTNINGSFKSYKYDDKLADQTVYEYSTHFYVKACNIFKHDNRKEVLDWIRTDGRGMLEILATPLQLPPNTIGLHCRRSDYGINIRGKVASEEKILESHIQLDIKFAELIGEVYKKEPLFISTDSAYTLAYFKNKFGKRLHYLPKKDYPKYSNRSENSLREALKDFVTLSSCRLIHRDSNSTFSFAASLLNNHKLRTWDRPVLKTCGATLIHEQNTNYR